MGDQFGEEGIAIDTDQAAGGFLLLEVLGRLGSQQTFTRGLHAGQHLR